MNRRDFLKALTAIPALVLLKPEVPEIENINYSPSLEAIKAFSKMPVGFFEGIRIGLGASGYSLLKATEPVVEAMAGKVAYGLELGPEGSLTIKGDFLEEDIEQVKQRHREYWARWNGQEFERLDTIEGDLVTQGDLLE